MSQEEIARLDYLEKKVTITENELEQCKVLYEKRGYLSEQYRGRPFLEVELQKLPDGFITENKVKNSFEINNIRTIRDLLDITRVDVRKNFKGKTGPRLWEMIYDLQRLVIDNINAIEFQLCNVVPDFTIPGKKDNHPKKSQAPLSSKPSDEYKDNHIYGVLISENHIQYLGAKINGYCQNKGIKRLIEILDITNSQISHEKGYGKKTVVELERAQEWIRSNVDNIATDYDRYDVLHELPVLTDEEMNLGLEMRVRIAMRQLYECVQKVDDGDVIANIDAFYIHPQTNERYNPKLIDYNKKLLKGESISRKIKVRLRQDIINDMLNFEEDYMYKAEEDAITALGNNGSFDIQQSVVFKLLGLKTTMIRPEDSVRYDQKYVIPRQNQYTSDRSLIASYLEAIHRTLTKNPDRNCSVSAFNEVRPMGYDEIVEYMNVYSIISDEGLINELDEKILTRLLEAYSHVVCIEENGIDKYQIKYEYLNTEGKFARIICERGSIEMNDAILINASRLPFEDHTVFENFIRQRAHSVTDSFDWITSINGIYHYSPRGMKTSVKEGVALFVASTDGELFTLKDLKAYLEQNGYPERSRNLIKGYVNKLCEENASIKDQFCDKEFIDRHPDITWVEREGCVHNKRTLEIQRCVLDKLLSCKNHMMKQSEMMHYCQEKFSDEYDSYTFFYKVLNTLTGKVQKVIMEDATYLKLVERYGATESIVTAEHEFDWEKLHSVMQEKMHKYYFISLDYQKATDKLLRFLQCSVGNPNLKKFFPRLLIRFWNGGNTEYDLNDIITNISTNFEGFLREIYRINNGKEMPKTEGLKSVGYNLPDFDNWRDKYWYYPYNQPAMAYYRNLYHVRNKLAHGVPLNYTTEQYKKNIEEFIALYVFTVDNFLKAA